MTILAWVVGVTVAFILGAVFGVLFMILANRDANAMVASNHIKQPKRDDWLAS